MYKLHLVNTIEHFSHLFSYMVSAASCSILPLPLSLLYVVFLMASPSQSSSSSRSAASNPFATLPDADTPTAATIAMVNIRAHVPVILEMDAANFRQWRTFFELTFKKFGLMDHVDGTIDAALMQHDPEWCQNNSSITSWLYTSLSKDLMDAVYQPRSTAQSAWQAINSQFLDNSLQRAVFLQQDFHSLYQRDMSITEYCGRLKQLADALYDVGAAVTNQALVINTLRGLHPDYSGAVAVLSSKVPPPTFLYTRSYLVQEEQRKSLTRKMAAATALLAAGSSNTGSSNTSAPPRPTNHGGHAPSSTGGDRRKKRKNTDGRFRNTGNASSTARPQGGSASSEPPPSWG